MASGLSLSFFIFFLAILCSVNIQIVQGQENHVLVLDKSNFTETLSKHSFIVVKFYAPWCGACVRIAPEYEKAASILSTHDPEIVLAKIDVTDGINKELGEQFKIQGVPSIKIFRGGEDEIQEYNGPRKADGIAKYLIKQLGPASVEVKSVEDADNLVDSKGMSIVGIFPKFSGEEFDNFLALAVKLRSDYSFGHTLDAKFISEGDKSITGPTLRLLKPFDERYVDSQDFQVDAMVKFIEEVTIPHVTVYNTEPMNQAMISKFWQNQNTKVH
ncbi:protein disulfide-isomerase-like [Impatiens glandulifera]|uniref:protein disulfide-isomerase-like n=1 Tax=Impatiens glandulifera TaxID=253017 RepID=UPI001FB05D08|nr:protein disulfide-isomerase-like [Impatiens glandulifera]